MFVFLCSGLFMFSSPSARFHLWNRALALPVAGGKVVAPADSFGAWCIWGLPFRPFMPLHFLSSQ
jgi:hypothetical protein